MDTTPDFELMALTPPGEPDPTLAIAASRAGGVGVLNLEFSREPEAGIDALHRLLRYGRGRLGVQVDPEDDALLTAILGAASPGLDFVALTSAVDHRLRETVDRIHGQGKRVIMIATCLEAALAGQASRVDGIIAKGNEAGGWVGEETSFVLLQRLMPRLRVPIFVQGGIGQHTIAACRTAGAAGVVLDSQLLLTRESPLTDQARGRLRTMDGSETVCLGSSFGSGFRCYSRPGLPTVEVLKLQERAALVSEDPAEVLGERWRSAIRGQVDWRDPESSVLAVGQDAAIAASLARRFQTVSDILHAMRESVHEHCATARRARPLAEHSPLARSHGTRFPIVQGPMTRVSDRAPFASSVAEAGGLPFLALALMRGTEVKTLLEETRRQLGERPWGVGILGFVPPELRAEQLEAIRACRPPFALIAGGRPDQSRALESDGVPTYLHVPSPGLLRLFLQEGARRFVFEGRECGGHVGPRTSFVLWESMVEVLLEHLPAGGDPAEFHVLFAGGIHDGLSAAMVSAIAAPLVQLGVRIGVLAGTAYLFTREAVATGAIVPGFQKAALACDRTVLLESGPGHATRCVESPFVFDFAAEKRRLIQEGAAPEDLRHGLEVLNIGRLRVASKGLDHDPRSGRDPAAPRLQSLDNEEQWRRGLYMIGQVAGLRHGLCSIDELHRSISEEGTGRLEMLGDHDRGSVRSGVPQSAVAIVGMACILPGAPDLRTFWSNIVNKVDSITEVPAERWDWRLYFDRDPSAKDKIYSRWGGFIDEVPFDPIAFGMPPSTLKSIEPFQLLALAVVRAALEDAGYLDRPFPRDRTSVILGAGGGGSDLTAGYMVRSCLPLLFGEEAPQLADRLEVKLPTWTEDSFPGLLMNVAAGRVANRFDLGGINCTVDAACASSLAAVYLAVRDLEARTSDVVLVGGVDAIQNPFAFLCFSKTQALSPNGRCRTFDAAADGIAISEGYAAVVMKRLEDAERDGDRIYAVIRGIGGSSDGRDRSMTSPRPEGQVRALARAYEQSGFSASTVGLIEAHGTGTVAGDQAEIQALTSFFTNEGAENQSCAVGSVKSMIGHSKATAGVAGLIKVALALKHRVLPPTIGVTTPNPKANFPASPFYVNTDTRPWINASGSSPRRAGVSAFGFGGTNFHVAVEEYTEEFRGTEETSLQPWPAEVLVWRGRSRADLGEQVRRLLDGLERGARPRLSELAYTMCSQAAQLEAHLPTLSILATSLEHLVDALRRARDLVDGHLARAHDARGLHFAERPLASVGRVAFLFPGQGSQYVNMGRELAVSFDTARSCFERADQLLSSRLGRPLSRWIFPAPVFDQGERKRLERALTETQIAQPALGATELAFLQVLRELDVVPQMLAGHSFGELVALHAAGCFNEETLLGLAECRGRFIKECTTEESGAMAAIAVSPDELLSMPQQMGLTVANFNGPRQTILSGPRSHIEDALNWCAERGIQAQLLPVSCAFHSPLVAAAQQRLAAQLDETPIASPQLPVFSNSSASVYPNEPSRIAELLSTHLVRPVEFTRQVEAMYEAGARIFVEVGPRNVLSGLVGQILGDRSHLCAPLDIAGRPDLVQFLDAIAAMAAEGVSVKFDRLHRGRGPTRLSLDKLASENGQPRHSPTTWLITGGTARPSPRPQQPADSPPPPAAAPRTGKSGQRVATDGRSAFIPVESQVPPTVAARNGHASGPPRTETPPVKSQQIDASSRPGARNGHDFTGKGHGLDTEAPGLAPVTNGGKMARSTAQTPRNSGHTSDRIAAHYKEEPSASPAPEQARLELARQFQQVMMRFLQTQENVMHDLLTYLGSPHGSVSVSTEETVGWHPGSNGNGVGPPYRTDPSAMFVDQPPATLPHERDFSSDQTGFFPREGLGHPEFGPLTPGRPSTDAEPISAKLDVHSRSPGVQPVIETIQQHVEAETSTSPASRETLTARLLAIVSERTGYPEEMLGLDADLEADLGIDSIKRVEIAGTMVRTLDVPKYRTPGIEQLTECRSLRQVVELLYSSLRSSGASNGPEGPVNVARIEAKGEPVPFDDARTGHGIGRFAPIPVRAPEIRKMATLAHGGMVVILDDGVGVGKNLSDRLEERGIGVIRVTSRRVESRATSDLLAYDLGSPDQVSALIGRIHDRHGLVAALIDLTALGAAPRADGDGATPPRDPSLETLLLLTQALRPDLLASAEAGGAAVISATAFGGAFGFGGDEPLPHPELGGRIGFIKTLAQEWREVRVKAVDLPRTSTEDAAARLFGELFAGDELTEVGYHEGERTVLDLSPAPLRTAHQALPVDRDSVVLVTGGARGITALAALAIAEIARPTIILVGRTSLLVAAEAAEMSHVVDQRDLRKAVLERFAREGKRVSPAYVEAACLRILRAREVAESIRKLENTGARVHYHSCDVSDAASFRCLIEEIYRTFGRIDGVIHGAGLIEDRLIKDKQLDSFRRVVDTKATSALVLARTLRPELLRFLVFFGSVSGRYGNRGQADYAAANEILNKLARDLDRRWPGRVISLNWGPWLGSGMVSPEVERQFADRGVVLIPPDVGCRMLVEELISGRKGDAEIVIGGANGTAPDLPQRSRAASEWDGPKVAERTLRGDVSGARLPLMRGASVASRGDDFLEVVRWLDPEVDLYLRDHVLDGHPVLPFAVAMELMAEVASIGWPGFRLREVHDIRLLRGIVVDESRKEIRVSARARPRQPRTAGQDASETLDVVITPAEGPRRVQYRAVVELERLSAEHSGLVLPGFSSSPAPLRGAGPMPMSIEEAYQKWLFHGPIFRGIQSIESICPDGARAILRMSSPNDCLRDGEPRGWLLDPVLIDSAFQMQVLWARLHWDVTLLPAGVQSCRFLDRRREDPGAGEPAIRSDRGRVRAIREELTYELRIRPESEVPLCTADHYFFDSTGRQVGTLLRVEGTGSRKLNRLSSPRKVGEVR